MMAGPPQLISMSPEGQKEVMDLRLPGTKHRPAGDNHLIFRPGKDYFGSSLRNLPGGEKFLYPGPGTAANGVFVNSRKSTHR